jgi:DNA primase
MTVDEMRDTLTRLGIEIESIRGDEIQAHCPAHQERTGKTDRNPSWWINSDSGAHNCFSCGWKGNLYTLVSYVQNIEIDKVSDWIGSAAGLSARFERITRPPKPVIEEPTIVTESMLSAFTAVPSYALQARGLTSTAAEMYGLKWDEHNKNWIIPIRDAKDSHLLGWQEKGYSQRYFNNKPVKIKKSSSLFGYEQYKQGTMVVVESPLDAVRLASLGITGGVAIYGAVISDVQLSYIRGADRILFALDNDEAGRRMTRALILKCKDLNVEAWFFNYSQTDMKDIGGMSLAEVEWGMANAKHLVQGEKAIC